LVVVSELKTCAVFSIVKAITPLPAVDHGLLRRSAPLVEKFPAVTKNYAIKPPIAQKLPYDEDNSTRGARDGCADEEER
jgi:hypothetical protein